VFYAIEFVTSGPMVEHNNDRLSTILYRLPTMTSDNDLFLEHPGTLWKFVFWGKVPELYNGSDGTEQLRIAFFQFCSPKI